MGKTEAGGRALHEGLRETAPLAKVSGLAGRSHQNHDRPAPVKGPPPASPAMNCSYSMTGMFLLRLGRSKKLLTRESGPGECQGSASGRGGPRGQHQHPLPSVFSRVFRREAIRCRHLSAEVKALGGLTSHEGTWQVGRTTAPQGQGSARKTQEPIFAAWPRHQAPSVVSGL